MDQELTLERIREVIDYTICPNGECPSIDANDQLYEPSKIESLETLTQEFQGWKWILGLGILNDKANRLVGARVLALKEEILKRIDL